MSNTDRQRLDYAIGGYFFTKIIVIPLSSKPEKSTENIEVKSSVVATDISDGEIYVNLNVKTNPEICSFTAYEIEMEATCRLTINEDKLNPQKIEDAIIKNAASICYGAIREKILSLTSRSVWGNVIIPPNYFAGLRKAHDSNSIEHESKAQ